MESELTKIIIAASLLPIILVSGIILRKRARPFSNILFTIHKTIAVVYTIFTVIVFINFFRGNYPGDSVTFPVIVSLALIIISFITGALQSFEKPPPAALNIVHKVSSYLMFISLPLTFIFIYKL